MLLNTCLWKEVVYVFLYIEAYIGEITKDDIKCWVVNKVLEPTQLSYLWLMSY